jgi:hypothetical protein
MATLEKTWRTVDRETQAQRLRDLINGGHVNHRYFNDRDVIVNEMIAEMVAEDGGLMGLDFEEDVDISEMITTSDGSMDLLQKVRVDVAFGLAEIPLLYGPIYDRINGPFPGGVFQVDEYTLQADVVFLQKWEGGEVQFGTLQKGTPSVGTIQTYAAGFEWTEDMVEFDQTWSIELHNRAFGRNYNALLNHLHLSPILGYSYTAANQTAANADASYDIYGKTHLTFQAAYTESVTASPQRRPTVLLASEANRFQIEQALLTPVYDPNGRPLATVPIDTIIYYDGETITRGTDQIAYTGVTAGKCYMIFPKRRFKEMVHHDLRIDIGPADISRLVEGQQVARARRGLYADIANSVEEITLPT